MMTRTLGTLARAASLVGAILAFAGMSGRQAQFTASEQEPQERDGGYCSSTASALFRACGFEGQDDYWKAVANYSLLEPGAVERKYFAPGVGFFLEVNPATGDVLRLTNCNFDARCANLKP